MSDLSDQKKIQNEINERVIEQRLTEVQESVKKATDLLSSMARGSEVQEKELKAVTDQPIYTALDRLEKAVAALQLPEVGMVWNGREYDYNMDFGQNVHVVMAEPSEWTPRKLTPGTYDTSHKPALAVFNDRLYMAWKGSADAQIRFAYYDGNSWSEPKPVHSDCHSTCGPALAFYKGLLCMTWKRSDNQEIWFSAFNGSTWSRPKRAMGLTTHSPALAEFNGYLYMAWKVANGSNIQLARSDTPNSAWTNLKLLYEQDVRTNHGPALARYVVEDDEKLFIAWKNGINSTNDSIHFASMNKTGPRIDWIKHGAIKIAHSTSRGPALASYGKYWAHTQSYDPIHKDLYMVWKGIESDSNIWESVYRIKEFDIKESNTDKTWTWTKQEQVSSVVKTSDTPALAEFGDKLYMVWKDASSSRIYYSHRKITSGKAVRNIFDDTRPGKPVVRQDDMAVLRIETKNMKIVQGSGIFSNTTPKLRKDKANEPAYLILHFPPQSIAEKTFFQVNNSQYDENYKEPGEPEEAKSRFDSPKPKPVDESISEACEPPIQARIAHESRLVFSVDNNFGDILYTLEGILEACKKLPLKISTALRPELPDATTTSIELPWRLILSPNSSAQWRHATYPVSSVATKHTELWHTQLVTPHGGKEVRSPYPDEMRTLRAIWALSGMGHEVATTDKGSIAPMQSEFPGSNDLPSSGIIPFRMPLDNFDRYQIAYITSKTGPAPGKPGALETNMMMLSPLGGWLDLRGAWDEKEFSLEQWSHRAAMGRDNYVRVVYRGYLFPFGHRVALIKISERKFNLTKSSGATDRDYAAYLHQRMYLVVNEKERFYRVDDKSFEDIKDGVFSLHRKFPFKSVKLLTEMTPDLDNPNDKPPGSGRCSVEGYEQKMFWPHVNSKPFRFQCVATDLEGRRVLFDIPMIYMDSTKALPYNEVAGNSVANYEDAIANSRIAMNNYAAKGDVYNTADLNLQRVALAPHGKPGDTSVQVKTMKFSGFTKEGNVLKAFSKGFSRPLWIPQVEHVDAKIESIANLSGAQGTHKLKFNAEYLKTDKDFGSDGNKGEVFVDIVPGTGPNLDFSSQGDKSGGFIQPNLKPAALSRIAGPVMSNVTSFMNGNMPPGAGFPTDVSDLPLPLLFGCIPLGDLIAGVGNVAGDKSSVPKFISEASTGVDSFFSSIDRLYYLVIDIPRQSTDIAKAALTSSNATLDDLLSQAAAYFPAQAADVKAKILAMKDKNNDIIGYLSNLSGLGAQLPVYRHAIESLKEAANPFPAGFKQSVLNTASKLESLCAQLKVLPDLDSARVELRDALAAIKNDTAYIKLSNNLDDLKPKLVPFRNELNKADLLDGAPRNILLSALNALIDILNTDLAKLVQMLTGEELTVRFDWNPKIQNWPNDDTPTFRANDKKGLLVAVEAKVKKNGKSNPNISVDCSLKNFDLILLGESNFIELNFEKIEFSIGSSAKPDVDVLLSDIKFLGPLSFVETLRDLIPLNGFSDPPYLDITPKGIDAGYSISLPSICCGVLNIANLSLAAGFTVPFIGEPMSVRFSFCRREQPFLLTVYGLGGGGFFGIAIDPDGVQVFEAALEFGAAIAVNLGVAWGEAHIMAGIYYRMERDEAALTGYLRLGGSLSVLGLISASIELYLALTYNFDNGKCTGRAQLTVEVSVFLFKASVTVSCERKFAGSNGDPTLRQMFGYLPELPLKEELESIDEKTQYYWRDYVEAFAFEEVI